jgi:aldose 1-epimerase
MALSGEQFTIEAGEHQATVVEVGAALRRYAYRGRDVTEPFGTGEIAPHSAGAVLVPWPNRIRNGRYAFAGREYQLPLSEPSRGNAMHGLARWVRWTAASVEPAAVTMTTDLVPQTGWPFQVRVQVSYLLTPGAGLSVLAAARNHGSRPAPFGAGFHPYLALHGCPLAEVVLRVPAARRLVTDEAQVPVGTREVDGTGHDLRAGRMLGALRMDDAFTGLAYHGGRGVAEMRARDAGARVWFDQSFGYLQVFTASFAGRPPAVAIEPMTCPADAFNSGAGLVVLAPGAEWTGRWGITPLAGPDLPPAGPDLPGRR